MVETSRRAGVLSQAFDPRHNAFDLLRLAFATAVVVAHGLQLARGWQPHVGGTEVGALGVDGFFVTSGFLVTASAVRLGSWRRWAWHRALRILPGFWVCLAVSALVLLPLVTELRGGGWLAAYTDADAPAWRYALVNSLLLQRQFEVGGLPGGGDFVANGSLWTLFYEALCYGAVLVLGLLGALGRRPWVLLAATALAWAAQLLVASGSGVGPQLLPRLLLMFLLGAVLQRWAHRVPVAWPWAVAALGVLAASLLGLQHYRVAGGALAFAYLCLWVAARVRPARRLRTDVSYGLYVYHWPLAQVLLAAGVGALWAPAWLAVLLATTAAVALASWRLVERPALAHKDDDFVDRWHPPAGRRQRLARLARPAARPAEQSAARPSEPAAEQPALPAAAQAGEPTPAA